MNWFVKRNVKWRTRPGFGLSLAITLGFLSIAGMAGANEADGDGTIEISGELKPWHKLTLTLDGPFAKEEDENPNPFLDYRMTVTFWHQSGSPEYEVPGYFAADGQAAETSSDSGTRWRAHLAPDKPGRWDYRIAFVSGHRVAVNPDREGEPVTPYHGKEGSFTVDENDKSAPDFRAKGRLEYVGRHHLRHAGTGESFLKAGADAPETFLAYEEFDGTETENVPLKTWDPHVRDWEEGDPSWQDGKGKGMIGALNYLSSKGVNAFSFIPYNAGGDGDNVWPFVTRNDKLHYDCSKLDQWQIVFDHAQTKGLFLHFKLQEQENDGNRMGAGREETEIPEALDDGRLGVERKLYLRELIARYSHSLALNWNLGEENTQTTEEQRDMARYIRRTDPYDHPIVVHTFPHHQDEVYRPLLGDQSDLTGASLQNSSIRDCHRQTIKWVEASAEAGQPWVVAFDEPGPANWGAPPDPGYQGYDGTDAQGNEVGYDLHDIRKYALWGTILGGGMGVEYYFGYQLPENDLNCEDWRSRDRTWDYCRIALDFFSEHNIPVSEMSQADALVGNPEHDNSGYCYAKEGAIYLVYLPEGGTTQLDLSDVTGQYTIQWFNPREGGDLHDGDLQEIQGGGQRELGTAPADPDRDWLIVVRHASRP